MLLDVHLQRGKMILDLNLKVNTGIKKRILARVCIHVTSRDAKYDLGRVKEPKIST